MYIGEFIFSQGKISSVTFECTTGWNCDVTDASTNASNMSNSYVVYIRESAGGSTTPTANLPDAWINSGSGAFYSVVDGTQYGGSASDLPDNLVIPSLSSTGVAVDGIDAYAFAPNDVATKTDKIKTIFLM